MKKILSLIKHGESQTIEFKTSFQKEVIESVVAFANTKGGKIFIGIKIQIKIFDNKITFFNPGKLYGDMTIEKLKTDNYQAQTRNKLVAEAFYLTDDVEKYGTGYIRVRSEISNYPTMKLDFEEMGNGYLVTLGYEQQKTTSKTTSKTTKEKLIDLIKTDNKITRNELAKELNISINTVKEYILKLKRDGFLKRVGSNRNGYWEVLDDK